MPSITPKAISPSPHPASSKPRVSIDTSSSSPPSPSHRNSSPTKLSAHAHIISSPSGRLGNVTRILAATSSQERTASDLDSIASFLDSSTKIRQEPFWSFLPRPTRLKLCREALYRQVVDPAGHQFALDGALNPIAPGVRGAPGCSFYILLRGSAVLTCPGSEPLQLKTGATFGNVYMPANLQSAADAHFARLRPPVALSACQEFVNQASSRRSLKAAKNPNVQARVRVEQGSCYIMVASRAVAPLLEKQSIHLSRTDLLSSLGLRCLEKHYKSVTYQKGQELCVEGGKVTHVLAIVEGEAVAFKGGGGGGALFNLGPRSLVGDIPALLPSRETRLGEAELHPFTALATTKITVLSFDVSHFKDRLEQYTDVRRGMVSMCKAKAAWMEKREKAKEDKDAAEDPMLQIMEKNGREIKRRWLEEYVREKERTLKSGAVMGGEEEDDVDVHGEDDDMYEHDMYDEEDEEWDPNDEGADHSTLDDENATSFNVDSDSLGLHDLNARSFSSGGVGGAGGWGGGGMSGRRTAPSETASEMGRRKIGMMEPDTVKQLDLRVEDFFNPNAQTVSSKSSKQRPEPVTVDIRKNRAIIGFDAEERKREEEKKKQITFKMVFQMREKKNPKLNKSKVLMETLRMLQGKEEEHKPEEYAEPKDRFQRFEFIDLEKYGPLPPADPLQFSPTKQPPPSGNDLDLLEPYPTITKERKLHGKPMPLVSHADGFKDPFSSVKSLADSVGDKSGDVRGLRPKDQTMIDKALAQGFFPYHMRGGGRPATTHGLGQGSLLQGSLSSGSIKMGSSIWTERDYEMDAKFGMEERKGMFVDMVSGRAPSPMVKFERAPDFGGGRGMEGVFMGGKLGGGGSRKGPLPTLERGRGGVGLEPHELRSSARANARSKAGKVGLRPDFREKQIMRSLGQRMRQTRTAAPGVARPKTSTLNLELRT
ncbi:hypothetical protein TeGR_g8127 [Tetraparma gracilis]|uniref:Cyclic nucleotide-binding domain-containing protein n=1 Tax=Tetraparma gracilis TaxID=2962635 RepID=A0ABQ6N9X0_9STRA|nr:hypothetical protein TeGR_g8127 [Tetraparma gracilis]